MKSHCGTGSFYTAYCADCLIKVMSFLFPPGQAATAHPNPLSVNRHVCINAAQQN